MSGQIMLTFDDGLATHLEAAKLLSERELCGIFGIVGDRLDDPGFLTGSDCNSIAFNNHFICNHSQRHWWSGVGQAKPGIDAHEPQDIMQDCLDGKDFTNADWYHGDYLTVPFGTPNIASPEMLEQLIEEFTWVRLTTGSPLPAELLEGRWSIQGHRKYFPKDYSEPLVGITEAADTRWPDGVKEAAKTAAQIDKLAVIIFHEISHVVGSSMDLTLKRFLSDIDYIADLVAKGELECVTPDQLVSATE